MAIAITIGVCAVLCGLAAFFCRQYIEKTYASVDAVLDGALVKQERLPPAAQADTRLAKLAHKASKIAQVHAVGATQTTKEKETIQAFLSDMSHQMKTPLSGISMYTDLLLEGSLSEEEEREFLSRIGLCVGKLQWMTESLVKVSRLEIGAIELSPVPLGIQQTVSESIGMVMASAAKKGVSICTEPFEDIKLLHDRKWTVEAMVNLLENAVKYSEEGGEIQIRAEKLMTYTKISFTDHGIGIPREEWNLIFKRFYRGENAKDTNGAGLGLYLTSLILEKQGGYILVDSKPGAYTAFSLFLQNCKN